jgi:AcrR family transcriptional regulator
MTTVVRKAHDTRRLLLNAAADLFARDGPRGARVNEIVQRAGINERMIYHHFGSKDGLYRAVLDDQWLGLAEAWAASLERAASLEPRAGLRLAFEVLFEELSKRPLLLPLALHEAMTGWQGVPAASMDAIPKPLRALYRRGQREGVFRADCDFESVYFAFIGAMASGRILASRFTDSRAAAARDPSFAIALGKQALTLLLDGVKAPPARGGRR